MGWLIINIKPKVIIPTGLGINSHVELAYMFKLADAETVMIHINELIENPNIIDDYHILGLAGGFTGGDYLGAGKAVANLIAKSGLYEKLREKFEDENFPIYAVCNFFQIPAKLNLFPIPVGTLENDVGKHVTGEWDLKVNQNNDTVWLKYVKEIDDDIFAPVSHGEGRIWVDKRKLNEGINEDLIALTYNQGKMSKFYETSRAGRYNPNGSTEDIAGFGWKNNLVLFPHIERQHHDIQRPDKYDVLQKKGRLDDFYQPALQIFKAGVDFVKSVN